MVDQSFFELKVLDKFATGFRESHDRVGQFPNFFDNGEGFFFFHWVLKILKLYPKLRAFSLVRNDNNLRMLERELIRRVKRPRRGSS